jgi:imidazolonepropionase-like amidohydrolase
MPEVIGGFINCTVFDGSGAPPVPNAAVLFEGDRIAFVGPLAEAPAMDRSGAATNVKDLHGAWVIPGLWDAHCHLALPAVRSGSQSPSYAPMMESAADRAARAGDNIGRALRSGLTSLRVLGEMPYVDLAWKSAIQSGQRTGPRLYVAGPPSRGPAGTGRHRALPSRRGAREG